MDLSVIRYYGPELKIPPNTTSVSVHDLTHVWHQIIFLLVL